MIGDLVVEYARYTATGGGSTSEFRVSLKDPAVAVDKETHEYTAVDWPGLNIKVFAPKAITMMEAKTSLLIRGPAAGR